MNMSGSPSSNIAKRNIGYEEEYAGMQKSDDESDGKIILVKRNDGTTQYLRLLPKRSSFSSMSNYRMPISLQATRSIIKQGANNIVRQLTSPARVIKIGPNGEQFVQTLPAGTRVISRSSILDRHATSFNKQRTISTIPTTLQTNESHLAKAPVQVQRNKKTLSPNLMPSKDDTPDLNQIKKTLDSLITQVCAWDKQYGWFKTHQRKPKSKIENNKQNRIGTTRMVISNQLETLLAEHVERLRREINKRRTRLENEAEILCGLPTPWRKSKAKPRKPKPRTQEREQNAKMTTTHLRASIVNPAEISLGDGSYSWIKNELKDTTDEQQHDSSDEFLGK